MNTIELGGSPKGQNSQRLSAKLPVNNSRKSQVVVRKTKINLI